MADEPKWTEEELREFRGLVDGVSEPGMNNMARPIARVRLNAFVREHGKEKCDAMFAHIEATDPK